MALIGGKVDQQQQSPDLQCCMICTPEAFEGDGGRLDVLQVAKSPPRKRRRVAVRKIGASTAEVIRERLKAERLKYIAEHPSLAILGAQFVCPDSVINSICDSAKYISRASDMDAFVLRQELKQRFLDVLNSLVVHNV